MSLSRNSYDTSQEIYPYLGMIFVISNRVCLEGIQEGPLAIILSFFSLSQTDTRNFTLLHNLTLVGKLTGWIHRQSDKV